MHRGAHRAGTHCLIQLVKKSASGEKVHTAMHPEKKALSVISVQAGRLLR
jgi:hypothetical protein